MAGSASTFKQKNEYNQGLKWDSAGVEILGLVGLSESSQHHQTKLSLISAIPYVT